MTPVAINPGSGPAETYSNAKPSVEQALANMKVLAEDCKVEPKAVRRRMKNDYHDQHKDGRFCFTLKGQDGKVYEIQMPGIPLDNVRFTGGPKQNPWDYPRLYVDDSSWLWRYAVRRAGGPADF
jgi:hypothetical protein